MNTTNTAISIGVLEAAQLRYARRIVERLSESAEALAPDISERLRFARESALGHARSARAAQPAGSTVDVTRSGELVLGDGPGRWAWKLASVLPLLVLIGGLILIQYTQTSSQISAAAEIDADLLADDLPPRAYSDAGFLEFLKLPKD